MAAHSDFFDALFTFEDKKEYKIKDMTREELKIILDCFYEVNSVDKPWTTASGQNFDNQLEVIATAAHLIAPILLKKAIKVLMESLEKATSDQILEILLFARNFQIKGLEDQVLNKWIQVNLRRAVKSKQTRLHKIRRVLGMGDSDDDTH